MKTNIIKIQNIYSLSLACVIILSCCNPKPKINKKQLYDKLGAVKRTALDNNSTDSLLKDVFLGYYNCKMIEILRIKYFSDSVHIEKARTIFKRKISPSIHGINLINVFENDTSLEWKKSKNIYEYVDKIDTLVLKLENLPNELVDLSRGGSCPKTTYYLTKNYEKRERIEFRILGGSKESKSINNLFFSLVKHSLY